MKIYEPKQLEIEDLLQIVTRKVVCKEDIPEETKHLARNLIFSIKAERAKIDV